MTETRNGGRGGGASAPGRGGGRRNKGKGKAPAASAPVIPPIKATERANKKKQKQPSQVDLGVPVAATAPVTEGIRLRRHVVATVPAAAKASTVTKAVTPGAPSKTTAVPTKTSSAEAGAGSQSTASSTSTSSSKKRRGKKKKAGGAAIAVESASMAEKSPTPVIKRDVASRKAVVEPAAPKSEAAESALATASATATPRRSKRKRKHGGSNVEHSASSPTTEKTADDAPQASEASTVEPSRKKIVVLTRRPSGNDVARETRATVNTRLQAQRHAASENTPTMSLRSARRTEPKPNTPSTPVKAAPSEQRSASSTLVNAIAQNSQLVATPPSTQPTKQGGADSVTSTPSEPGSGGKKKRKRRKHAGATTASLGSPPHSKVSAIDIDQVNGPKATVEPIAEKNSSRVEPEEEPPTSLESNVSVELDMDTTNTESDAAGDATIVNAVPIETEIVANEDSAAFDNAQELPRKTVSAATEEAVANEESAREGDAQEDREENDNFTIVVNKATETLQPTDSKDYEVDESNLESPLSTSRTDEGVADHQLNKSQVASPITCTSPENKLGLSEDELVGVEDDGATLSRGDDSSVAASALSDQSQDRVPQDLRALSSLLDSPKQSASDTTAPLDGDHLLDAEGFTRQSTVVETSEPATSLQFPIEIDDDETETEAEDSDADVVEVESEASDVEFIPLHRTNSDEITEDESVSGDRTPGEEYVTDDHGCETSPGPYTITSTRHVDEDEEYPHDHQPRGHVYYHVAPPIDTTEDEDEAVGCEPFIHDTKEEDANVAKEKSDSNACDDVVSSSQVKDSDVKAQLDCKPTLGSTLLTAAQDLESAPQDFSTECVPDTSAEMHAESKKQSNTSVFPRVECPCHNLTSTNLAPQKVMEKPMEQPKMLGAPPSPLQIPPHCPDEQISSLSHERVNAPSREHLETLPPTGHSLTTSRAFLKSSQDFWSTYEITKEVSKKRKSTWENAWGATFGIGESACEGSDSRNPDVTPLSSWFLTRGPANFKKRVTIPREKEIKLHTHTKPSSPRPRLTSPPPAKKPRLDESTSSTIEGPTSSRFDRFLESLVNKSSWRSWYSGDGDTNDLLDPPVPSSWLRRLGADRVVSDFQNATVDDLPQTEAQGLEEAHALARRRHSSKLAQLEDMIRHERRKAKHFDQSLLSILQGKTLSGKDLDEQYAHLLPSANKQQPSA